MPESRPIGLCRPVISCFRHLESRNLNDLVLILFCLERDARSLVRPQKFPRTALPLAGEGAPFLVWLFRFYRFGRP